MDPLEQYEHEGLTVRIFSDDHPESPREWDNFGTMISWHRRANLGDETIDSREFESQEALEASLKARVILPLYLYEHSGMTIRTVPFGDPWDSGQVGYIYATEADIKEAFNVEEISDAIVTMAEENLRTEVKTYDQWLTGDVYGFSIEDGDGDVIDSCWGFYGLEEVQTAAKDAAKDGVETVQREKDMAFDWACRC